MKFISLFISKVFNTEPHVFTYILSLAAFTLKQS